MGTPSYWPVKAMNFQSAKRELLETALDNPDVCFEQKVDGTRALVLLQPGCDPHFVNRHGTPLAHSAALIALPRIDDALREAHFAQGTEIVLDGEVMWDSDNPVFLAFDMPFGRWPLAAETTPDVPYGTRRGRMLHVLDLFDPTVIRPVAHAEGREDKLTLAESVKHINGEGIMVKHLLSPYKAGSRVTHSLKVKFTKTADVIVTAVTKGRNKDGNLSGSIEFAVLNEPVEGFDATVGFGFRGSCSAIGREGVEPGMVIEVEYLAWTGTGMREPRMTRIREDKKPSECTMGQFTEHSKAVL